MELSKELLAEAKECKSAEEISVLAKENGVELTKEAAQEAFEKLNKKGELQDNELNGVSGGCGSKVSDPKFAIGQRVRFSTGSVSTAVGTIVSRQFAGGYLNSNCWVYEILHDDGETRQLNVWESEITAI